MSEELKAELVIAVRGYECEKKKNWDEGIDFTASDAKPNEKILLRVITDPRSNSGVVGVDAVRKMVETIEREDYDSGVLVSERFSDAAKEEMMRRDIQIVSERITPRFKPEKLYIAIKERINDLCKIKCGRIPRKESDCKGKNPDSHYSCKVRLISDNALFHFERGWTDFLREDLKQLLTLQKIHKSLEH